MPQMHLRAVSRGLHVQNGIYIYEDIKEVTSLMNNTPSPSIASPSHFKRILSTISMVVAMTGLFILGWLAYEENITPTTQEDIPLVKKDPKPFKVKPEERGGMQIPHQDKQIFSVMRQETTTGDEKNIDFLSKEPTLVNREEALEQTTNTQAHPLRPDEMAPVPGMATTPTAATTPHLEDAMAATQAQPQIKVNVLKRQNTQGKEIQRIQLSQVPHTPKRKYATVKKAYTPPANSTSSPATSTETAASSQKSRVPLSQMRGYRAQLGSYRSLDRLEQGWNGLQSRFPALLDTLDYTAQRVTIAGRGVFFRLQAGPFPTKEDVRSFCKKMQSKNEGCLLARE